MKRREEGFSILEIMIALAIVMVVLFAAINFFIISLRQYKVQTKIVETDLEGILGLELFRRDLESLGYGLPWNNLPAYTEIVVGSAELTALNDSSYAPRAVVGIDCASFTVNRSDYLAVKSDRVGMDNAAGKWTTLASGDVKRSWVPAMENLQNGDYVVVMSASGLDTTRRAVVNPGTFYTTYANTSSFVPGEPYSANIVYGIGSTPPARPFNRADYYISAASVPAHCAPNTGVLVKAVVPHDNSGVAGTLHPLLDCVADMQVVYHLDTDADGDLDSAISDIDAAFPRSSTAAANMRDQLKEIRVYILAQEGQRDDSFRYPSPTILVGPDNTVGNNFNVEGSRNYRWRVYTIAVKPANLAQ
jgi:hypothetical protein